MARRRHAAHVIAAGVQALILAGIVALPLAAVGEHGGLLAYLDLASLDATFQDRLFRLRNSIQPRQPISPDVTLVGIDDRTDLKLGQYGKGDWRVRLPFIRQLGDFRVFKPRVVAYDVLFSDALSEQSQKTPAGQQVGQPEVDGIKTFLQTYLDQGGDVQDLDAHLPAFTSLGHITGLVADSALAFRLSQLRDGGTIPILAYHVPVDSQNQTREWQADDILGPDPADRREGNGVVTYLKVGSIPTRCVVNRTPAFYLNKYHAALPSQCLMDFGQLGFINVPRDADGAVRRLPLIYGIEYEFDDLQTGAHQHRDFVVPSLALQACLGAWGLSLETLGDPKRTPTPEDVIRIELGRAIRIRKPDGQVVRIPIDENGVFYPDFVGQVLDYRTVSFADVGRHEEMKEFLGGKVVFVGLTATGSTDVGPTPVSDHSPFVLAHMTTASNLLTGTFIRPLRIAEHTLLLLALGAVLIPASLLFRPKALTYLTLVLGVGYVAAAYLAIHCHWLVLPLTGPLTFLALSYLVVLLVYYLTEARERQQTRRMFSTMVSGDVLRYMDENPESFSLAGEEREATVMFSDVAGFTTISESLSAEDLVQLLNAYLTPMTEIIMATGGSVDKYQGDGIMAEWGVPFADSDHARQACLAALDQQARLAAIREDLHRRFGHYLRVRMGLNSGVVSAGNMGSSGHFSYTVMGDAVNLAARLEPANKDYGTSIIIADSTFQLARDDVEARLLDKIIVKGKTMPIQIHELLARKGRLHDLKHRVVDLYQQALRAHWKRDFPKAAELFQQALAVDPGDAPSRALLARVTRYLAEPPPPTWQGEYIRAAKD